MAEPKDELASLDDAWEELLPEPEARPASVLSMPVELAELDDGWNETPRASESPRAAKPAGVTQQFLPTASGIRLTKRQRREFEKQQRRLMTQRRAERKQARKQERREEAKRRAAEHASAVVRSVPPKAKVARQREPVSIPAPVSMEGRGQRRILAPSRTSGASGRHPAPRTSDIASARAARQRSASSIAIYALIAVVVAAAILWLWWG